MTEKSDTAIFHQYMLWRLLHALHWAVLIFVLSAWALPWTPVLWLHLFFVPSLIVHWRTNENRCVLTELEEKLKAEEEMACGRLSSGSAFGGAAYSSNHFLMEPSDSSEEGGFIKAAWTKAFGQEPSDELLLGVIHAGMILVWSLTLIQLLTGLRIF